ncbi:MAG: DUF4249 domain-containing protein [Bacteroidaceae bacterium]|nr:DUF4249 domain-containing protein [Bacteroidaceae bacterium]
MTHTTLARRLLLWVVPMLMLCASCGDEVHIEEQELVIEGWIADGEFPVVMVTTTLPIMYNEVSTDSIARYVAQWARVGICVDGQTTYLTGMYDRDYFIPYVFTTSAFRGQAGKSYRLIVDWRDQHAEAVTTIPESVPIDDVWCEPSQDNDTLRQVIARFHDNPSQHNYYLWFSRAEGEPYNPQLCMLGALDDETLTTTEVVQHIRRSGPISEVEDYTPYYSVGAYAEVSLLHVDSTAYAFWHGFSDTKMLGNSNLFNVTTPISSNIQGGHGVWYGCGVSRRRIKVQ